MPSLKPLLTALILGCSTDASSPDPSDTGAVAADTTDTADTADTADSSSAPDPDEDADGFPASTDCDDTNAGVFPDAPESCNEEDDNCDGRVDEGCRPRPEGAWTADMADADLRWSGTNTDALVTVLSADVDGDGRSDVVTATILSPSGLYYAPGPFAGEHELATEALPLVQDRYSVGPRLVDYQTSLPDADGDGQLDLLATSSSDSLFYWPNIEAGADISTVPLEIEPEILPWSAGWAAEGVAEVVPGDPGVVVVSVYSGFTDAPYADTDAVLVSPDETGVVGTNSLPSIGPAARQSGASDLVNSWPHAIQDMNGDGSYELSIGVYQCDLYMGPISATDAERLPDWTLRGANTATAGQLLRDVTSGDLDRDGRAELLAVETSFDYDAGAYSTHLVAGRADDAGVVTMDESPLLLAPEGGYLGRMAALDMDADGNLDLAVAGNDEEGNFMVTVEYGPFAGTREPGSAGSLVFQTDQAAWAGASIAAADTNADGAGDLIIGSTMGRGGASTYGEAWVILGVW